MNRFWHGHAGRTAEKWLVVLRVDPGLYTMTEGSPSGNRMQSVRYGLVLWCLAGALSPVSGISWGRWETMHNVSSQNLREMKDITNSWLEGQNRKSKGEGRSWGGTHGGGGGGRLQWTFTQSRSHPVSMSTWLHWRWVCLSLFGRN